MRARFLGALFLSVAVASSSVLFSADAASRGNARFTFEIGQAEGSRSEAPRVVQVICEVDGKTQTVYGSRVPIPTTVGESAAPSYSYQNIGLTLSLSTRRTAEGPIELEARIEGTLLPPSQAAPGQPPTLGSFSHDFRVLLTTGKTVRVVDIGESDDAGHYVDVRADWIN